MRKLNDNYREYSLEYGVTAESLSLLLATCLDVREDPTKASSLLPLIDSGGEVENLPRYLDELDEAVNSLRSLLDDFEGFADFSYIPCSPDIVLHQSDPSDEFWKHPYCWS